MADKDVASVIEMLEPYIAGLHSVAADSTRAMPPDELAALAESVLDVPITTHDSVEAGLTVALGLGEPVLATGSMYVAGEARIALGLA
jgi:dihydrofolate synthase/folylpolyglutamate synthase